MADDASTLIIIGVCIFAFLLILLGIGSFYGGDWSAVAQGVAPYILLVVAFAFGCIVLVRVMKG